jgi:hypothetical protein
LNLIKFQDVATKIDPTSVYIRSLTAPEKTWVQEQNYEYDLATPDKLLAKYLEKEITVKTEVETYLGKLLSYVGDSLILETAPAEIVSVKKNDIRAIQYPSLPEELILRPTLVWYLFTEQGGKHLLELTYLTSGISWRADYIIVVNPEDTLLDLNGWIEIDNQCGATFPDAELKLIAGKVHRVIERRYYPVYRAMEAAALAAAPEAVEFEEEKFFEYHIYTLERPTTIKDKEKKEIRFLTASNVPVKKEYLFDPSGYYYWGRAGRATEIKTTLTFKNSEENGLGMALPQGKVRTYKADSEGKLQFIGEDKIKHTPKDEDIRIYVGDVFDIVGERRVLESTKIDHGWRHKVKIEIRNHKDVDVQVIAREKLWGSWEIVETSQPYDKIDAYTIEYKIDVPADGVSTVNYTVIYKW